ncbi:MAG: RNA 3'-terminal phosphate cyclase, partial [Armatimonadota bacterium]
VFHSIFPALAQAHAKSQITIRGGTHVPWSPPFHHLSSVFLPTAARMGFWAELTLVKCGYYPRGGGEITATVFPSDPCPPPFVLESRGHLKRIWGLVGISNLPTAIATRIASAASSMLRAAGFTAAIDECELPSVGQGVFLFLCAEYEHSSAGFSSLGERGKPSEAVAREAVDALVTFHKSNAAVEPHLADQLVLLAALSGHPSTYTVARVTEHLRTNAWVVQQFLPVVIEVKGELGEPGRLLCSPHTNS